MMLMAAALLAAAVCLARAANPDPEYVELCSTDGGKTFEACK